MLATKIMAAAAEYYRGPWMEDPTLGGEDAFEAGARWVLTHLLKHCPQTYEPKHGGPEVEYLEYREFKQLCEVEED